MHGVACGAANASSPLHPTLRIAKPATHLNGAKLHPNALRTSVMANVTTPNNVWAAESCSRAKAFRTATNDTHASSNLSTTVLSSFAVSVRPGRAPVKAVGSESTEPFRTSRLGDPSEDVDSCHSAPAGMADRIAAASERYANRQQRRRQQQPGVKPYEVAPHDPGSCRFWEVRILSRTCHALAFHISSHFHVPKGPTDPLASVLSCSSSSLAAPAPPASGMGAVGAPPPQAASASHKGPSDSDPYGMYDNLPAVYALKAVASALVDPLLWQTSPSGSSRATGASPAPSPFPSCVSGEPAPANPLPNRRLHAQLSCDRAAVLIPSSSPSPTAHLEHQHHNRQHQMHQDAKLDQQQQQPTPWSPGSSVPNPGSQHEHSSPNGEAPHGEVSPTISAVANVVAGSVLRLAHSCGHPGCYSLAGPPPPPSTFPSVPGSDPDETRTGRLAGVPFTGRQLMRLYDMAHAAECGIDVGALAGVPASTAAALLVLLACAQPQPHPAVAARQPPAGSSSSSSSSSSTGRAGAAATIPAALLARYLRVGSRAHNPLDTVRVMWALLRLQLPGAGPLLLPLESFGSDSGSSSSDTEGGVRRSVAGATAASRLHGAAASASGGGGSGSGELMSQLSYVLARQLRNRDRAMAALKAARPGELYGTWQLAVQALTLVKERVLAQERSASALAQLDSALEMLEATLVATLKDSVAPSAPASTSGSESASQTACSVASKPSQTASAEPTSSPCGAGTPNPSFASQPDCFASLSAPIGAALSSGISSSGALRHGLVGNDRAASPLASAGESSVVTLKVSPPASSFSSSSSFAPAEASASASGPVTGEASSSPPSAPAEATTSSSKLPSAASKSPSVAVAGSDAAQAALTNPAVEALQLFLEVTREGAAAQGTSVPPPTLASPAPAPAWDVVPRSDAEWRLVLAEPEQRVALLFSTWPELCRLVSGGAPAPSQGSTPPAAQTLPSATPAVSCSIGPGNSATGVTGSKGVGPGSDGRIATAAPYVAADPVTVKAASTPTPCHQGHGNGNAHAAAAEAEAAAVGRPREPRPVAGDGGRGVAAVGPQDGGSGRDASMWSQRRLRLQLKPYSDLHVKTLELLYRALKAQAPDARLYASLSHDESDVEADAQPRPGAPRTVAAAAAASAPPAVSALQPRSGVPCCGVGGSAAASLRFMRAVALPHQASVDMVYTDARGRQVGLCLAHLGASRRAPGELAVLHSAMYGWPEAEVEAAQQGFRAARSAAKAAAAAAAAHTQAQAAHAAAAAAAKAATLTRPTATQISSSGGGGDGGVGGGVLPAAAADVQTALAATAIASATIGLMRNVAAAAQSSPSDAGTATTRAATAAAAAAAGDLLPATSGGGKEQQGEAVVWITTPVAAAPAGLGTPPQESAVHAGADRAVGTPHGLAGLASTGLDSTSSAQPGRGEASSRAEELGDPEDCCLCPSERASIEAAADAIEADAAAVAAAPAVAAAAAAKAASAVRAAADSPLGWVRGLEGAGSSPAWSEQLCMGLDDLLALELDHDWFHLRERYYSDICKQRKWDEEVRQAVGMAMSYTELPWEAQLDMIWYVLASAGAAPPIRVFS